MIFKCFELVNYDELPIYILMYPSRDLCICTIVSRFNNVLRNVYAFTFSPTPWRMITTTIFVLSCVCLCAPVYVL